MGKRGQIYRQIRRDTRSRQRRGAVANETIGRTRCPLQSKETVHRPRGDDGALWTWRPRRRCGRFASSARPPSLVPSRLTRVPLTTRFRLLARSYVSVRSTERGLSACVGHIFGLVSTVVWWLRQSPGTCLNSEYPPSLRQMPDACLNILASRLLRTPSTRGTRVRMHCHTGIHDSLFMNYD